MIEFLATLILVLAIILVLALRRLQRDRAERKQRGLFSTWPIRKLEPPELDPRFATGPLGPSRDSEISFIANYRVAGGISDRETWILCAMAIDAKRIFEFGTATGKTAYLLARNAPADARITTLTLGPGDMHDYRAERGDAADAYASAVSETRFDDFFYSGSDVASKIEQLFGDSKAFDDTPFAGVCDLVFIDGSHARSYVDSDSRKALRMVKPGGIVFWHDYRGPRRTFGVFGALNALAREVPLVHIAGTSLVAHRRPVQDG